MYNENVKQEYMSTVSTSVEYILNNLFNKAVDYEEIKEKDVYDFVEEDILEFFTGMNSSSVNTLTGYASLLRSYTQWCVQNNINADHINHFDNITVNMLDECVNKLVSDEKYISLEQLQKVMDNIVNVCDRYLVLALFEGICGKECCELTNVHSEMINKENKTIKLATGREIHISDDLIFLISQSCNTYDYILTSNKRFDSLKLDDSNTTAFKPRANARFSTQERAKLRVTQRLIKLREDTGCLSLTISRLQNSGVLHRMKNAIEKENINPKEQIFEMPIMKEIQKHYNIEHQPKFQVKARYEKYI